jgi:4-amino-4-deoxy-L-arabinose transferase-like glycosyltransferase
MTTLVTHGPSRRALAGAWPTRGAICAAVLLWSAAAYFGLAFGPGLGDHEVIVAECGRQILQTGDWIVPSYLDVPFVAKPPLSPWLAALAGLVFPTDPETGMPVSATEARLPSAISTLLTALVLCLLGRSMFSRRAGWIAAFVYGTSLGALLFAFNATAEAMLTFFCTWAFAEFWWARGAASPGGQRLHLALFYVALGLGMLTKGPMPLMLVAAPIAVWWWLQRPTRLAARGGLLGGIRLGGRQAWPLLRIALTRLGLSWGVPLFLLMFLPWMILVGLRIPYAWEYWEYEYLDRARGNYPGCHPGNYFYYVPILFGTLLPWCLSLPEAFISPFLAAYHRQRKGLTYAWYWVLVGLVLLSVMSFKKPYYILPAAPGCALLLGPVLERFFFGPDRLSPHRHRLAVGASLGILLAVITVIWFVGRSKYQELWLGNLAWASLLFGIPTVAGCALTGAFFVRKRRVASIWTLALTMLVVFATSWTTLGKDLANVEDPLALVRQLREHGVPDDADLYWASNRPDGRVLFYGCREVRHVLDPYKLLAEKEDRHTTEDLLLVGANHICDLLENERIIYIVFQRDQFSLLMAVLKPPARELFSIDRGKIGADEDDWVIVTNSNVNRQATPTRMGQ